MEDKDLVERLEARSKAYIEFLTELNEDRRKHTSFLVIIIFVLIGIIIGSVFGMVWVSVRSQNKIEAMADRTEKRIYEFLSEYDFTTSYNLDTGTIIDSDTSGNISFNQR